MIDLDMVDAAAFFDTLPYVVYMASADLSCDDMVKISEFLEGVSDDDWVDDSVGPVHLDLEGGDRFRLARFCIEDVPGCEESQFFYVDLPFSKIRQLAHGGSSSFEVDPSTAENVLEGGFEFRSITLGRSEEGTVDNIDYWAYGRFKASFCDFRP